MSKGITYEAILSLSLEAIAEAFPHGAREVAKGRFEPADEGGATKTLDELVKAKKARQEKPSYLRASYSIPRPYVRNPNAKPRPGENDNYTSDRAKALGGANEPEERVPADVQKRITKEAHERFRIVHHEEVARAQLRSKMGRVRQVAIAHIRAGMSASVAWKMATERIEREDAEKAA